MRIELTIKTSYLQEWGKWEGVREIVQNAHDASSDGFPLSIKYSAHREVLTIKNKGARIPHQALLMGHTTKHERDDQIGQFGEGLKLGTLALTRRGNNVRIRSGNEIWTPKLVQSEKFEGAEVLAFDIRKGKNCDGVEVEIGGISSAWWSEMERKFLFLGEVNEIRCNRGALLLDPDMVGKIFVKGIFVQKYPVSYGYDMWDTTTDRDRRMVSSYDLRYNAMHIWSSVMRQEPDMAGQFYKLLESSAEDLSYISSQYGVSTFSEECRFKVCETFYEKYGSDAIPVLNMSESKTISHMGKRGIVAPEPLVMMVMNGKSFEDTRKSISQEIETRHAWLDLNNEERKNIEEAVEIISWTGESVNLDNVEIVTLRGNDYGAHFKWGEDRAVIDRRLLSSRANTLKFLVHEIAHRAGGDGEREHVYKLEDIWSAIVESFR